MDEKEFYKDCEYDIHVYKKKGMENSRQEMRGTHRLAMLAGVCSFLQSCLETGVISSEKELDWVIETVKEARKNGARNKVIYNGLNNKDNIIYPNFNKEGK